MKLYRLLLSFYPARFREEYGGPLEHQFLDEYREATSQWARLCLWFSALRDLAWSIPIELAHELKQDLEHSLRVHARRPFVIAFTIAILALAIGGATGVFSVVNAVLIKSLPFRDPGRLVVLNNFARGMDDSPAAFHKWRTASAYLDDVVSCVTADMNVSGAFAPARVTVAETSFNFFSALGSEPILGRAFAPSEDVPGNDSVAVIGYSLWQQLFGGDPRVLGSKLLLNGVPTTIVGVARPGLNYPEKATIWTPTVFDLERLPKAGVFFLRTFGRLKTGIPLARAGQMFASDVKALQPELLKDSFFTQPMLIPLNFQLAEHIREASLVLMAAIGFVLLIACANVANLLLTRTTERHQELAVRAALGASRARLMQQLLSECVLLSFIAATAGLAIAYWAAKLASIVQPPELAAQTYTILDWRVLGFAVGIAMLTGLLFGVVPALLVRRLQPAGYLVRAQGPGLRTSRLRSILIATQVALTLALLTGAMTMGQGFLRILGTDIGFRTAHLVTASVSLAGTREQTEKREAAYYSDALSRLRNVTGVESAAAIDYLPLAANAFSGGRLYTEAGRETEFVMFGRATSDYFRTMQTPLLYGREFTEADSQRDAKVAIVTEGIARQVAEGGAAIGHQISRKDDKEPLTIVGVVRPARYLGPQFPGMEEFIQPAREMSHATFVARVRGDAKDSLAMFRDAIQSVDAQVPVFGVKTLDQRLEETLAVPRFRTTVFLFFGGFALLLAIAGIYGVSSYSITQRRREIGIRIAIGASAQRVRAMILRQALWPIGIGMLIGLAGASWQGRILEHLLSGAPPVDMTATVASALLLALVGIAAIWTATSRVLELNPIEVLKAE
jgi:predicted permease